MNTNNGEGNSEIPEVEDLVIEDGDTAEIVKTKAEKYKEQVDKKNAFLFARTKKAEGFIEDGKGGWVKPAPANDKKPDATQTKDGLTTADVFTLVKNNIPEEDVPDVAEYAKLKGITISEALKTNVVKTILADKAEQRKVAEGSNTGDARRGSSRLSDEALLQNASKGNLPTSAEDISRLTKLKLKEGRK